MTYLTANNLSPQESRVCELLMTGLSDGEVAKKMFRSPKTICTYKTRAFRKLGVKNSVQLLLSAQAWRG